MTGAMQYKKTLCKGAFIIKYFKMSEMDAIINNYDEKKYKEESSTAYETSSPQQTEYTSDSFLPFYEKKLEFTFKFAFSAIF